MLTLAVAALVMPAPVDLFAFGSLDAHAGRCSIDSASGPRSSCSWSTSRDWCSRSARTAIPLRAGRAHPSRLSRAGAALILLAIGTLLTTVEAEILVRGLEPALTSSA